MRVPCAFLEVWAGRQAGIGQWKEHCVPAGHMKPNRDCCFSVNPAERKERGVSLVHAIL